jgi:hypothetical protein
LLPREAIAQFDPAMFQEVVDLLLRELVLLFRVRHYVESNFNIF